MKSFILFIVFFQSLVLNAFAQIEMRNESLILPEEAILYLGVEQFIQLKGLEGTERVELVCENSKEVNIKDEGNLRFKVTPKISGNCILNILKNGAILYNKIYVVKPLEDFKIRCGDIRDSIATKGELLEAQQLNIYFPSSLFSVPKDLRIASFSMSILKAKTKVVHRKMDSFHKNLTSEMKSELQDVEPGDKIFFDRIILGCIDGADRKMPGFVIEVID